MVDKEIARELRGSGLTYQQIADILGVSKQRIFQLTNDIKGNNIQSKGKPWTRERRLEYVRNNILTVKGRTIKVKKRSYTSGVCELCGKTVKNKLYYHHWDDNDFSLGIWVCQPCHWFIGGIDRGYLDIGLHNRYLRLKSDISLRKI